MKKCEFYTLHNTGKGLYSVKHSGYESDDGYYYYKNGNAWFAVHPDSGVAVAQGNTRKEAVKLTKENESYILEELRKYADAWYKRLRDIVLNEHGIEVPRKHQILTVHTIRKLKAMTYAEYLAAYGLNDSADARLPYLYALLDRGAVYKDGDRWIDTWTGQEVIL